MTLPKNSSRTLGSLIGDTPHDFAKRISRNTVLYINKETAPGVLWECTMRIHDGDVLRLVEYGGRYFRMYLRTPFVAKLTCDRLNGFGPEGGRFELTDGVIYYTEPDGQNVHPLGAEWGEYPYIRCKIEDRI